MLDASVLSSRIAWLMAVWWCVLTSLATAATTVDLYTVTVPRSVLEPAEQRADEQQRAMLEAITRITGSRAIAYSPEVEPLLAAARRYIDTYGTTVERDALVRFIPGDLEAALTELGLPVWGAERPLTVFWIAVTDDFGERALLSSGAIDPGIEVGESMATMLAELRTEIDTAARVRGLPYVLPEFDVRDLAAVTFDDVWAYDVGRLREASARYGADAVAVARVRNTLIGTDVEWLVSLGFDQRSLPGASLQQGIDWIADTYAAQYASVGGSRPVLIRVTGVDDFDEYARTVSYLEALSLLDRVDVESFQDGQLMLRVQSRGDAAVLARLLSLGGVLREANRFGVPSQPGILSLEVVRNDFSR